MFLIKLNINNCNAKSCRSICFLRHFRFPRRKVSCVYGHVLFVFIFITTYKNGNTRMIIKHDNKHWALIHHVACVEEVSCYKHECFIYKIGLKRILLFHIKFTDKEVSNIVVTMSYQN